MIKRLISLLAFTVLAHADLLLTLSPSGDIAGAPGANIGWGFTLTSTDSTYDVITGSSFCLGASNGVNNTCISPVTGTYTDFAGPQFIVLGPSPESLTASESFDGVSMGVGLFSIYSNATPGAVDSGQIVITYDEFTEDPNSPTFDPNSYVQSEFTTAEASVTVTGSSAVPEPASVMLVGTLFIMVVFWRVRSRAA
jgi:hypothetical protein